MYGILYWDLLNIVLYCLIDYVCLLIYLLIVKQLITIIVSLNITHGDIVAFWRTNCW